MGKHQPPESDPAEHQDSDSGAAGDFGGEFKSVVRPGAKAADTSLLAVVESYVRYYASGSGHTARAKRLDLDHFVRFLTQLHGLSKPEKLNLADWSHSSVQRFVDECLGRGEAPATAARRLATIKHMGRTFAEKIPGFINPARDVRSPKVRSGKPKGLKPKEIGSIRRKANDRISDRRSFTRLRNQALFNLLLDTGIRADEVRLLRLGQLDESLEWIRNVRTKGRRYRNVYVTSGMRAQLEEYLALRQQKLLKVYAELSRSEDRSLPLFISTYRAVPGQPASFLMGAKTIWRAVNELSAKVHLHPHLLRHSYALDLIESSNDVRLVAQALGHSDVRITMRYTERRDDEIAEALERSRRED